jgi:Phospholipase_D-nuclease N-terminal
MARRWGELSERQQSSILVAASLQLSLAATAWADLVTRPPELVNGRKSMWAAVIGVNFVGPMAYFAWGRLPHR